MHVHSLSFTIAGILQPRIWILRILTPTISLWRGGMHRLLQASSDSQPSNLFVYVEFSIFL